MSEYEPGTVATATVRGVPGVRVFRSRNTTRGHQWFSSDPVQGDFWHEDRVVVEVRSLVVLDPETLGGSPANLRKIADHAERTYFISGAEDIRTIADQIEAQTRPPKPPEPTGLGAVVEDAAGRRWVRNPDPGVICKWRDAERRWRNYGAIDAVRVLSEGVSDV